MRSTQQCAALPCPMKWPQTCGRRLRPAGEYASESEVIRDGLRALQERNRAVEHWLRNEVVPAFRALKADPSRGSSLEETRTALAKRHAARLAKTPER